MLLPQCAILRGRKHIAVQDAQRMGTAGTTALQMIQQGIAADEKADDLLLPVPLFSKCPQGDRSTSRPADVDDTDPSRR